MVVTEDYSDKRFGTIRKATRYILSLPFSLAATVLFVPAVVAALSVVLIGALLLVAVCVVGVVSLAVVIGVPAALLLIALSLGPFTTEDMEIGED